MEDGVGEADKVLLREGREVCNEETVLREVGREVSGEGDVESDGEIDYDADGRV